MLTAIGVDVSAVIDAMLSADEADKKSIYQCKVLGFTDEDIALFGTNLCYAYQAVKNGWPLERLRRFPEQVYFACGMKPDTLRLDPLS